MPVRIMNLCTRWTGVDNSTLPQLYPWKEPPRCLLVRELGGPYFRRGRVSLALSEVEPKNIDSHTTDGANCLKDMTWYRVEPLGFQFM